jgi:hypothetical protein
MEKYFLILCQIKKIYYKKCVGHAKLFKLVKNENDHQYALQLFFKKGNERFSSIFWVNFFFIKAKTILLCDISGNTILTKYTVNVWLCVCLSLKWHRSHVLALRQPHGCKYVIWIYEVVLLFFFYKSQNRYFRKHFYFPIKRDILSTNAPNVTEIYNRKTSFFATIKI